ncbi:MAG: cysteine desulfurase family protein [Dehalococcoidales bacterium]|nr:cysteine desulfurase family protein [Dehalococcoidales bacterium]
MKPIYLDYNATTPLDRAVEEATLPYLKSGLGGRFGNPSSSHQYGRQAHAAIDAAREQVAGLLGCTSDEIVFTGCGSEADNLAIKGVAEAYRGKGNHIITSQIEHPAVLNTCRYLERHGCQVTYLPVDEYGLVDPAAVEGAITERTVLISIMHANNEVGTVEPVAAIGAIAHRRGVLFHTDAAQSVGKIPTKVDDLGVDLLTVAGHKLYAPKGVGALYVRAGTKLEPLIHGAGHEGGRRAGTENVPHIVALGKACEIAGKTTAGYVPRLRELRDRLHRLLAEGVDGLKLNGHPTERLPNTLNVSFPGADGEALLARTPQVAASTGSACHAGRTEPSAVLLAMGIQREAALGAVRFSLGKFTTAVDVDQAAAALIRGVKELWSEAKTSRG